MTEECWEEKGTMVWDQLMSKHTPKYMPALLTLKRYFKILVLVSTEQNPKDWISTLVGICIDGLMSLLKNLGTDGLAVSNYKKK